MRYLLTAFLVTIGPLASAQEAFSAGPPDPHTAYAEAVSVAVRAYSRAQGETRNKYRAIDTAATNYHDNEMVQAARSSRLKAARTRLRHALDAASNDYPPAQLIYNTAKGLELPCLMDQATTDLRDEAKLTILAATATAIANLHPNVLHASKVLDGVTGTTVRSVLRGVGDQYCSDVQSVDGAWSASIKDAEAARAEVFRATVRNEVADAWSDFDNDTRVTDPSTLEVAPAPPSEAITDLLQAYRQAVSQGLSHAEEQYKVRLESATATRDALNSDFLSSLSEDVESAVLELTGTSG